MTGAFDLIILDIIIQQVGKSGLRTETKRMITY